MRVVKTPITVSVLLLITRHELWHIIKCAKAHYDSKCRSAAESEGFLYGWANQMWQSSSVEVYAEWSQLDTIAKILEGVRGEPAIYQFIHMTLEGIRTKQEKLNKKWSGV